MAAVRCYRFFVSTLPLQLQELLADTHIDGVPGQDFIFVVSAGGVEIFFDSALAESIIPLGEVKVFIPAIQSCAICNGCFDNLAKSPVAPGKYSLQTAQIGAVVVVFDGLGIDMLLQQTATAQVFLGRDLLFPLEGSMGLGNKISSRHMDP